MHSPLPFISSAIGRAMFRRPQESDGSAAALAHVRRAIAGAELHSSPFPHIIVTEVLPTALYDEMLARWPERSTLPMEPGGLDRYMGHLTNHGTILDEYGAFWRSYTIDAGLPMIRAALERFRGFNDARFGTDAQYQESLAFFESGPAFEQHGPHTHHNHNPDWAMTCLLFMEDGGREDRGETFSAPVRGCDWLDIVSGVPKRGVKPVKRIPFRPNTLLAWLDGPMSFHGTDMLPRDPERRRRMLRCHVNVDAASATRSLGDVTPAAFFAATQRHLKGDSNTLRKILSRPTSVEAIPRFDYAD